MKPTGAVREGDDYIVSWDVLGLALHFTRVRETDSAIRCLATPITIPERKRVLAPMMVNLFTKADRERMADAIRQRVEADDSESSDAKKRWRDIVEDGFAAAIDLHTTVEPLVNLAEMEPAPDSGSLIEPSVLLHGQINVLLADQKSGKSYDVLMIAVAVALGRSDLLPPPLRLVGPGGPVIYYDSETDKGAQRRRLERIAAGLHLPRLPDVHYRRVRPPIADRSQDMQAEIARLRAALVIVDSLTFSVGGNINDPEVSGPTMNVIGDLGEGVTKLLTAHHAKASRHNGERPSIIGSGLFEMKARNIWLIRRESELGEPYIDQAWTHEWINDGRQESGFGMRLTFNDTNTKVEFTQVTAQTSQFVAQNTGTEKERVLAAVMGTDLMKLSTRGIAAATGIREQNVTRAAKVLISEGKFKLLEGGRGKGMATYATVFADRPERINGVSEPPPPEAPDERINGKNHPKGNRSDSFAFKGAKNQESPIKESERIVDSLVDEAGWFGMPEAKA